MSIPLFSVSHLILFSFGKYYVQKKPGPQTAVTEFQICSEEQYHNFLAARPPSRMNSFLQSAFWGRFKSGQGWKPQYFRGKVLMPKENREHEFALLVLSRSLLPQAFPALFSLAYIPFGPVFFAEGQTSSAELFATSRGYFATCRLIGQKLLGYIPLSCFFVRLDSNYLLNKVLEAPIEQASEAARDQGFYRAVQRVQVPDTVLLDLRYSEEELLAQMHKKHRYNIRLAQKRGVWVRCASWQEGQESLEEWYGLYQITAQRDKIAIHNFAYYRSLFEQSEAVFCIWPTAQSRKILRPLAKLWVALSCCTMLEQRRISTVRLPMRTGS